MRPAARPEVTGRSVPRGAYTIPQFCASHGFSRATYYNLKARGEAPAEMYVLGRVLISVEAAKEWRRERTAATAAAVRQAGDPDPEEEEILEVERGAPLLEHRVLIWAEDPAGGPENTKVLHVHIHQLNQLLAERGIAVRGSHSGGYHVRVQT